MIYKILDFLRDEEGYVSGEDISSKLKISRAAIWKHIQELKERGYDIEAVPHLGYKLISSPDRLIPAEISYLLGTKFIGRRLECFETIFSTMDTATELALQGAEEGTVVCAEAQSKGRGRLGRSWSSVKGKGIYFSLILRPDILPLEAPKLTILAAVSCCRAIRRVFGIEAGIKWPNDIMLSGKKAGGILTELNAEMDRVKFIVIGIGINVNNQKQELLPNSTSIRQEKGENVRRVDLFRALLEEIEKDYTRFLKHGISEMINEWRSCSVTLQSRVKVLCQRNSVEGVAVDIDADGSLLIRKDSGFVEKVVSGDVVKAH